MTRPSLLLVAVSTAIVMAFTLSNPAAASDAEPTMKQVYEAATTGHLDKAQEMITEVLANHPASAKAHWVQAEIFAKAGKGNFARSEVLETERLNPGLTDFSANAVRELKTQLGLPTNDPNPPQNDQAGKHLPEKRIQLENVGGTLVAPVVVNSAIKLNFVVDSGASD